MHMPVLATAPHNLFVLEILVANLNNSSQSEQGYLILVQFMPCKITLYFYAFRRQSPLHHRFGSHQRKAVDNVNTSKLTFNFDAQNAFHDVGKSGSKGEMRKR